MTGILKVEIPVWMNKSHRTDMKMYRPDAMIPLDGYLEAVQSETFKTRAKEDRPVVQVQYTTDFRLSGILPVDIDGITPNPRDFNFPGCFMVAKSTSGEGWHLLLSTDIDKYCPNEYRDKYETILRYVGIVDFCEEYGAKCLDMSPVSQLLYITTDKNVWVSDGIN